jgi:hypothetical protein
MKMVLGRVDAGGQPVDDHLPDAGLDALRVVVVGRQRVPVGREEQAGVLGLQLDPVFQDAVVVAEVEPPGGAHAGEDAFSEHDRLSKSKNDCENKTEDGHQRPEDVAKDTREQQSSRIGKP